LSQTIKKLRDGSNATISVSSRASCPSRLSREASSPCKESGSGIARLILWIGDTIDQPTEEHEFLLARKSGISEEGRESFLAQVTNSITEADRMIAGLSDNVNCGKISFQGNGLDFAREVFRGLDLRLRAVRRHLLQLRATREKIKHQSTKHSLDSVKVPAPAPVEIDESFQQKLIVEHDTLVDELLENREMIIRIERTGHEIAQLQSDYNALMVEQTERIRVIRRTVDEAAEQYEHGQGQLDQLADRSKRQNLWISIIIIVISLFLLIKQLREDLKRM
jgi:hypothetical protein